MDDAQVKVNLYAHIDRLSAARDEAIEFGNTAYDRGYFDGMADAHEPDRDKLAEAIDAYMSKGGEFRAYDLADRLIRLSATLRSERQESQASVGENLDENRSNSDG
jgi:hypothetical protein